MLKHLALNSWQVVSPPLQPLFPGGCPPGPCVLPRPCLTAQAGWRQVAPLSSLTITTPAMSSHRGLTSLRASLSPDTLRYTRVHWRQECEVSAGRRSPASHRGRDPSSQRY